MRSVGLALAAAVALSMTAPAFATTTIVYRNLVGLAPEVDPSTAGIDANVTIDLDGQAVAEDFLIADGATVTGATVYLMPLLYASNDPANIILTYYLFASAGDTPGALIQSAQVPFNVNLLYDLSNGNLVYQYSFDFVSPMTADAGTTYWLGLSTFSPSPNVGSWAGEFSSAPKGNFVSLNPVSGDDTWYPTAAGPLGLGTEMDFYLVGSALSAVPEPSTWAMMLLGFGGIGFVMRGRRAAGAVAQAA